MGIFSYFSASAKELRFRITRSSKTAPIDSHEECKDLKEIWDSFVDAFVGTLHAQGGSGCATDPSKKTKKLRTNGGLWKERVGRLYAIGDVHGDLRKTREAFRACGMTDASDRWCGGDSTVVQVGDQLDRGPDEVAVMYFLERVAEEAELAGGEVVQLLGNHETLNMSGRFRYATKEGSADFTRWRDRQKIGMEMKKMCFGKTIEKRYGNKDEPNLCKFETGEKKHQQLPSWIQDEQSHEANRWRALCPGGEFTKRFFARQNVAQIVGSTLFVHAGVLEHHALYGLENINEDIKQWALKADNPRGVPPAHVQTDQSIVWARDYAHTNEDQCDCSKLERALSFLPGVERVVVGHTIQQSGGGATATCNGKVIRVDVGMSRGCGGNVSEGVEILNDGEKITRLVFEKGRTKMTGVPDEKANL